MIETYAQQIDETRVLCFKAYTSRIAIPKTSRLTLCILIYCYVMINYCNRIF